MAKYANITGWGKCMPPAVLTNDDFATVIETSDEWIRTRSGIAERRVSHVPNSDLAAVAALRADPARLLEDIKLLGFLFESLVIRDLRVHAQAGDANVYQYRDNTGLEIDAIVETAA